MPQSKGCPNFSRGSPFSPASRVTNSHRCLAQAIIIAVKITAFLKRAVGIHETKGPS